MIFQSKVGGSYKSKAVLQRAVVKMRKLQDKRLDTLEYRSISEKEWGELRIKFFKLWYSSQRPNLKKINSFGGKIMKFLGSWGHIRGSGIPNWPLFARPFFPGPFCLAFKPN